MEVYFQPIVGFDSDTTVAAEALLRATLDGIPVNPSIVIAAAESAGRIREIGRHVIAIACAAAHRWQQAAGRPVCLSVNLAADELNQPDLVAETAAILTHSGLDPRLLWLELTETALIGDTSVVRQNLIGLRSLGVSLVLDDFGTGFASLSHLRSIPLAAVKLDQQFIANVDVPGADHEIVRSVIRLAHALDLRTVAEGVETIGQRDALAALGCDAWQGFLRSKAVPSDDFITSIRPGARPAPATSFLTVAAPAAAPLDSFVLRRISADRWAHIGGDGRGEGWAGIVDVDASETPRLAQALQSGGVERVVLEHRGWLFGPYHPGGAVIVPLGADTLVIFGAASSDAIPTLDDEEWTNRATALSDRIHAVSPAKRLGDELELSEALQALLATDPETLDEAMRDVVESVASALSCEFAVLYLRESGRMVFSDQTFHAVDTLEFAAAMDALTNATSAPSCRQNASAQPLPLPMPRDFGVRSWIALPTAPRLGGLIVCAHTDRSPRGFTSLCQRMGARLAEAAELVLHTASDRERLSSQAQTAAAEARCDPLTGLFNRLGWNEAVSRVERVTAGGDVAVLVADVNNLKIVNDRDGHEAGDELLKAAADLFRSVVRSTDIVARIGGDEFGVLLPNSDEAVCRRLLAQIARDLDAASGPGLSIAVGHAVRLPGESIATTIAWADDRMYAKKRAMKISAGAAAG
jgi:diguanylate cyclase (GGDEF)-like protein